ncbi:MAG: c-type cytochrome [Magnetococcales bacterium]|nr:c-type cytochrome [Magnetococcales bacterium]
MKSLNLLMGVLIAILVGLATWWTFRVNMEVGLRLVDNHCTVCHDDTKRAKNRKGPPLWGVYGREAGTAEGYGYSAAFMDKVAENPFVWDEGHLSAFIEDPNAFISNSEMGQAESEHTLYFTGIRNAANRRDVIAYLKTLQ